MGVVLATNAAGGGAVKAAAFYAPGGGASGVTIPQPQAPTPTPDPGAAAESLLLEEGIRPPPGSVIRVEVTTTQSFGPAEAVNIFVLFSSVAADPTFALFKLAVDESLAKAQGISVGEFLKRDYLGINVQKVTIVSSPTETGELTVEVPPMHLVDP